MSTPQPPPVEVLFSAGGPGAGLAAADFSESPESGARDGEVRVRLADLTGPAPLMRAFFAAYGDLAGAGDRTLRLRRGAEVRSYARPVIRLVEYAVRATDVIVATGVHILAVPA